MSYKKYMKPNTIWYFQGDDFISRAIIKSQTIYTLEKYNKKSQWHHVGFIGSDGYFYESTVKFSMPFKYGIKKSSIKKLEKKIKDNVKIGIQYNLAPNKKQLKKITAKAQEMLKKKIKYGGLELFGTLWTLIKWRFASEKKRKKILEKENPFNTSNVYCCAFVIDCFKAGGFDLVANIDSSVTVVDETWLNLLISNTKKTFKIKE